MSKQEIYKELGAYERHFNQIQGTIRGLASAWLLATFGGIAASTTGNFDIIDRWITISVVATAGGIGIGLLWLLDVKVYHALLLAVVEVSDQLEKEPNSDLPKLREKMKTSVTTFSVRRVISFFYLIPMAFFGLTAIAFHSHSSKWNDVTWLNGAIWLATLGLLIFCFCVFFTKRPDEMGACT